MRDVAHGAEELQPNRYPVIQGFEIQKYEINNDNARGKKRKKTEDRE